MWSGCRKIYRLTLVVALMLLCAIRSTVYSLTNSSRLDTETTSELEDLSVDVGHIPQLGSASDPDQIDSIIFVSTLDGTLNAVSKNTGQTLWVLKEDPVLKTPVNIQRNPMFLTNPKDGSLYMYNIGFDSLKKLPFTIPDLVVASPCKSSDGVLYTGYKKDTWLVIDPLTGNKLQTLNMEGLQNDVCPSTTETTMLLGRTEYSLMMFDSITREVRWNATFMDYSSHVSDSDEELLDKYRLRHFASSSAGSIVTLDSSDGQIVWTSKYSSPVVAIYTQDDRRGLRKIPFVSVAGETLEHLTGKVTSTEWREKFRDQGVDNTRRDIFYPTLYIGEERSCFYALPSLVDGSTVTVVKRGLKALMIEGPELASADGSSYMMLGHHEEPDTAESWFPGMNARRLITAGSGEERLPAGQTVSGDVLAESNNNVTVLSSDKKLSLLLNNELFIAGSALCGLVLIVAIGCLATRQRRSLMSSEGQCVIGSISFNSSDVIGHGCAGTFVYKGRFDGRDVAVKRILPRCFTIADREVALLRESDEHVNVVRYFVMERDAQFCYIALELCAGTLQDYVDGREIEGLRGFSGLYTGLSDKQEFSGDGDRGEHGFESEGFDEAVRLLHEAMSGLSHLHSLHIVHRDLKPNNVLLSRPDCKGRVRAVLSDFGLCKKINSGRQSLSKSGVLGTDGWIAAEMSTHSVTCAVDIFSAGCLIYYVLTAGSHPFGDVLSRQANIQNATRDLRALSQTDHRAQLVLDLVSGMTEHEPAQRARSGDVLGHPLFWSSERTLLFLERVSDRLDKLTDTDLQVLRLESGGLHVVHTDWTKHISQPLRQDLRRYRAYRPHSVRDLLRAMRNKRHHHRELSPQLLHELGESSEQFLHYFTSRFPSLLIHTYHALSLSAHEPAFTPFY